MTGKAISCNRETIACRWALLYDDILQGELFYKKKSIGYGIVFLKAISKYVLLFIIIFSFEVAFLWSKEINNYRWHYSVNLPASWLPEYGDDGSSRQVFHSPDHRLTLEVRAWERREIQSLDAMYLNHLQELHGDGIVSRYNHMGYEVLLARIDYYSPQMPAIASQAEGSHSLGQGLELEGKLETVGPQIDLTGDVEVSPEKKTERNATAYTFYFYGARYAYRVASMGPENATILERDIQDSVLDSFGFEGHNYWNWGPVSSFFVDQKNQAQAKKSEEELSRQQSSGVELTQPTVVFANWQLGNYSFRALQKPLEQEVAEKVLLREKRILEATTARLYPYALVRFYYMNFRQNYQFLKDLAIFLGMKYQQRALEAVNQGKIGLPVYEYLLYDLQNMLLNSKRSTDASPKVPLELPSQALSQGAGNIETLALISAILNSHFQHNAMILYSPTYLQLLVGVEELGVKEEQLAQKYDDDQNPNNFPKYNGITITWYKNRYLIGELIDRIYIGWARTPLRDLEKWIPLTFPRYVVPSIFP